MKKVVVALALASVGFSPVFATEAVAPKTTDAKKPATTEEQAVQNQAKTPKATLIAGNSSCTASEEKKEAPKQEQPVQMKTQKVALCDSSCATSEEKKEDQKQEQPAQVKAQKVALIACCATSEEKKEDQKQEQPAQVKTQKVALV